jgi:HEPN domain-containing protein
MDNNRSEFEKWFKQAEFDLGAAEASKKSFNYEWACFQSQQGAEKALKAFLFLKGKRMVLKHSINSLLRMCLKEDTGFKKVMDARELDKYYISTRYPNGLPDGIPHEFYTEEDAEECIQLLRRVLSLIRELTKT